MIKYLMFRKKAVVLYEEYLQNSKIKEEELKSLQLKRVINIFNHAKKNSKFYNKKYSSFEINTFEDWEKIPITSKEEIRSNTNTILIERNNRKTRKVTTGGSTGVPLTVYHDKSFPDEVLGWRMMNWWGLDPSCDKAIIYRKVRKGIKAFLNAVLWYPTKRIFLDASNMSSKEMKKFLDKLLKIKPPLIQGYVGGVMEFAQFCEKERVKIDFIKAVWVTSSPLSEPNRVFIEKIFNSKVYDQYGCSEVFWLAAECEKQNGLHVFSDFRFIEILNEKGESVKNEEYGDIVITDLTNYVFPLIRYGNGDRGRYLEKNCSCGVTLPLIDKVKGRISDNIKLPGSKVIAGEYLTTVFDDMPDSVKEFQIYQHSDFKIDLICVPTEKENSRDICEKKRKQLEELTENKVPVKLMFVLEIEHNAGKTRFIISEIK